MPDTLRLILGDQLNREHSWYKNINPDVLYVMMEIRQETDYVVHHVQKIIAFFTAMRAFSNYLKDAGHDVIYIKLDDTRNTQSLTQNLARLIDEHTITNFEYQLPDEYRLDEQLKNFCASLPISTGVSDTEHFMSTRPALDEFFVGKKTFLMESFYRMMRKRYKILMEGNEPLTGQWNYDAENRKKLPTAHLPIEPLLFEKDVTEMYDLITRQSIKTIGKINPCNFIWATTREEALILLDYFLKYSLPNFGIYEDAMSVKSWSVYHSRLSFCLNVKLLAPLEIVQHAIAYWKQHQITITIAQIEGFVRQIIGWREYMRGIYWSQMPAFATLNYFEHDRKLPEYFWTGNTNMNCMKHAINQSLDFAYAHHIQRLMITGNFALLAGISPDALDEWYLGIYIDAIEWVEITNTRGMSQFADGGIVGTKPYVSSANYIDKMSDYCSTCYYDKTKKTGPRACPFNSLYWHFYNRHEEKLSRNPRIGMAYNIWKKMAPEQQQEILEQAENYLAHIEAL